MSDRDIAAVVLAYVYRDRLFGLDLPIRIGHELRFEQPHADELLADGGRARDLAARRQVLNEGADDAATAHEGRIEHEPGGRADDDARVPREAAAIAAVVSDHGGIPVTRRTRCVELLLRRREDSVKTGQSHEGTVFLYWD